jgi:omega-6 fatty acid desaturase (delta-12 desaturase)
MCIAARLDSTPTPAHRRIPPWREPVIAVESETCTRDVDEFAHPHLGRSSLSIATSVLPFLGLWVAMYFSLSVSYLLTLALAVPAAGFLVRSYILFHDCTHGSLFRWRWANVWLGSFLALIFFTPFARWRYDHVGHHATAGDLDRRGLGDVPTLTLAEYEAMSRWGRFGYRMFRNPLIMFGIGPAYAMLWQPRFVPRQARAKIYDSTWRTNFAIAITVVGLCWLVGWQAFLAVEVPLVVIAGAAGLWLFYVQHQFEDVYWRRTEDWNYADAALRGSSYLRLPKILQFFTGNIGLHHVHHLNPRVPNYYLQRAHDHVEAFQRVPTMSLWDGLRAVRFKVWDESGARLLTWGDVRRLRLAAATTTG